LRAREELDRPGAEPGVDGVDEVESGAAAVKPRKGHEMPCYRQVRFGRYPDWLPVISKMKVTEADTVLAGARLALPLAVADLVDGIAFGAIAAGLGAGWLEATTMSATAYSGSAQYATLTIVRDGGSLAWVLAAVVGLNAR